MSDNENGELTEEEKEIEEIQKRLDSINTIIEMNRNKLTADELRNRFEGREDQYKKRFYIDPQSNIKAAEEREKKLEELKAEKETLLKRLATLQKTKDNNPDGLDR